MNRFTRVLYNFKNLYLSFLRLRKKCPFSAHFSSKPWTGAVLAGSESLHRFSPAFPSTRDHFVYSELLKWKSVLQEQVPFTDCLNININVKNKIDMLVIENKANVGCRLCPHITVICSPLYLSAGNVLNLTCL